MEDSILAIGVAPNTSILADANGCVKAPHRAVMPLLFGEKLRYLRTKHDLTQLELARLLGLAGHGHITNLEHGRDAVSLLLVVRVMYIFNVPSDYLLRDSLAVNSIGFSKLNATLERIEMPRLFGAKLRTLRLQREWGQTVLARKLGLARRGYISNLEGARGNKMPSLELIVRIADLFDVTTDYLLRDDITLEGIAFQGRG